MKSEWMITLLTAGGILILCAAMIIWDKIRQRKWFLRHLKQRWGTVPDREYTQEELTKKVHNYEIEPSGMTVVCLDYAQNGIGSNSCGPELLEKYRLDKKNFKFEMKMIFKEQ